MYENNQGGWYDFESGSAKLDFFFVEKVPVIFQTEINSEKYLHTA